MRLHKLETLKYFSRIFILLSIIFISLPGIAKVKKSVKKPSPTVVQVAPNVEAIKEMNISFLPESKIRIDGDSTVRKFSATTEAVELNGKAIDKPEAKANLPWTPTEIEMVLAVKNLKSGDGTLDYHMHENLKAEKFPQISLKLTSFKFSNNDEGGMNTVTASGTLTVSGVTKPIALKATLAADGQNLRIKGNKLVLMTDYGIEPPTMMLGTLKTRNEIEISFDVICILNNKQKG